jgi:hypothetical protein
VIINTEETKTADDRSEQGTDRTAELHVTKGGSQRTRATSYKFVNRNTFFVTHALYKMPQPPRSVRNFALHIMVSVKGITNIFIYLLSHCSQGTILYSLYYTIITPTKCTLLLLKAPDITICTLCHYILHLHVSTRVGHLQGAQCQCLAKVIINYNLLKLC